MDKTVWMTKKWRKNICIEVSPLHPTPHQLFLFDFVSKTTQKLRANDNDRLRAIVLSGMWCAYKLLEIDTTVPLNTLLYSCSTRCDAVRPSVRPSTNIAIANKESWIKSFWDTRREKLNEFKNLAQLKSDFSVYMSCTEHTQDSRLFSLPSIDIDDVVVVVAARSLNQCSKKCIKFYFLC